MRDAGGGFRADCTLALLLFSTKSDAWFVGALRDLRRDILDLSSASELYMSVVQSHNVSRSVGDCLLLSDQVGERIH